jgi:hypothetical protein
MGVLYTALSTLDFKFAVVLVAFSILAVLSQICVNAGTTSNDAHDAKIEGAVSFVNVS